MGKWLLKFEIIRGVWHVMSWVFYWACQSLCLKRQSSCTREDIIISYQVALCSLFLVLILAMHSRCRSAEPKVENVTCCVRAKQCCSCRPSPSRIHWKFNTSGSASQTCVILLQKEQLLHYMSPRREFFSTFLASPIAVFLFGVRQDQDSSALSFPRSFSLLPCRLFPGHSPFESELIERERVGKRG